MQSREGQMDSKEAGRPGVLVGWSSHDLGDRIVIQLENVTAPPPHSRADVKRTTLLLDKQQAVLLGEYLCKAAGQSRFEREPRGLMSRIFAG